MVMRKDDSDRALELLKKLRKKLPNGAEKSIRNSMDRLIVALENINEYYQELLTENSSKREDEFYNQSKTNIRKRISYGPQVDLKSFSPSPENTSALSVQREELTSPIETSEWEYIEVVISRPPGQNQTFGFSVAGGYDAPQENGDPSIYVTRIAPGGLADLDNRLRRFDQIISVNGIDLTCVANQEAVQILRDSGNTLAMIIRRFAAAETTATSEGEPFSLMTPKNEPDLGGQTSDNDDIYYEVNLVKPSPNTGLGFTIAGGCSSEASIEGIFVTKLTPGGLAEKNGQIQPGDRLIQVNGQELGNSTHDNAVSLLLDAGTHVHLVLSRQRDPMSQLLTPSTLTPTDDYDGN